MLKLFALTLILFFIIPTHSMHIKSSRLQQQMLQQRSYATMSQENFYKLVDDPLPLCEFAFQLATIQKDNEDLKNLRIKLVNKVYYFEDKRIYSFPGVNAGCLALALPTTLVGMELTIKAISHLIGTHSVVVHSFLAIPVVIICGGISLDCFLDLKRFVVLKSKLNLYKKKLAYVESLVDKIAHEEKNKE